MITADRCPRRVSVGYSDFLATSEPIQEMSAGGELCDIAHGQLRHESFSWLVDTAALACRAHGVSGDWNNLVFVAVWSAL